jgi:hypothetical protein
VGESRSFPHLTPTLSAPEGGEGEIEFSSYCFQHAPNVFHYIPIPKPDHAIALPGDFLVAHLVCAGSKSVLPAIELNDQLRRRAGKIRKVSANRVLTPKSNWEAQSAQFAPQPLLSLRHVSS